MNERAISLADFFRNAGIFSIAWYVGLNGLIPTIGAVTLYTLASKYKRPPKDPNYLGLIAITLGYALWFAVGGLLLHDVASHVEAVILFCLAVWLWFRPGFWPFILTIGDASLGLMVNVPGIFAAEFGSFGHKAHFTHIAIRVVEVCLVVRAFWLQVKRDRAEEAALIAHFSR
jgi:hypothetical protein